MEHIRDALLKYRDAWKGQTPDVNGMALFCLFQVVRGGKSSFDLDEFGSQAFRGVRDPWLTADTFLAVAPEHLRAQTRQLLDDDDFKRRLDADVQHIQDEATKRKQAKADQKSSKS